MTQQLPTQLRNISKRWHKRIETDEVIFGFKAVCETDKVGQEALCQFVLGGDPDFGLDGVGVF